MSVVHRTVRRIQNAAGDCHRLTKFYLKAPKSVEIESDNGSAFSLPAEYLRIYSPAADSKIRSVGGEKVIYGRRHVGIMSAEPVGNYGVSSRALSKATQKMAATSAVLKKTHKALRYSLTTRTAVASNLRRFSGVSATATAGDPQSQEDDDPSSLAFTFSSEQDPIFVKGISKNNNLIAQPDSVSMPMSFMTGSIVGKRFYQKVTAREADDGNGWTVMLDYRTLKTPAKRPLKCPTPTLAMAIAAEWDYQQTDGIRPFTMPLMKLACTALERVPLTRPKIIEHLTKKFHQDLVFCRAPGDNDLTKCVLDRQVEKIDPLLNWLEKEFGHKPVVYSSFFGGKQGEGLVAAIEALLRGMDDCELASIDAIASAAHSLVIAIAMFRGRLGIEEAIELIRLEEDLQVDRWGLVEGGHDIDIADLRVQISSASVFLGLSRRN